MFQPFETNCDETRQSWTGNTNENEKAGVFTSGKDGYKAYRIPAIVVTRQGTLLAFAEGRESGSDMGEDHESIRRHSWPKDGRPGAILFSNPASEKGRVKMTVRTSYDDGRTWPVSKQIYAGGGAYSCLVVLPDGHIGCLYEADGCKRIIFARFSLDWLTDGTSQK